MSVAAGAPHLIQTLQLPATASFPESISFSPDGRWLALGARNLTTTPTTSTLSLYSVPADGTVKPVAGWPRSTPSTTGQLVFSPNGLLAFDVAGTISSNRVTPAGSLSPVLGSPFAIGVDGPLALSPDGGLLAIAQPHADPNGAIAIFTVSSAGALSPVPGSPFPTLSPTAVTFNRTGELAVAVNNTTSTATVLSAAEPLLQSQLAPAATLTISRLLRTGRYTHVFQTTGAGRVTLRWFYVPHGASLNNPKRTPHPELVASGTGKLSNKAPGALTTKLTNIGRRVLATSNSIRLTAQAIYTASTPPTITATKAFMLKAQVTPTSRRLARERGRRRRQATFSS